MKNLLIECPTCGKEYLPIEIFIPNNFFGREVHIIRDEDDNLVYFDDLMDLNESFVCDRCLTKFDIHADIFFTTKSCDTTNFNEDYKRVIKK